jgi:hypothetical protein
VKLTWRQMGAVALAVLAVLALGWLHPHPNDAWATLWASIGAGGGVFAVQFWVHARDVDAARVRDHINGLFQIGCQALLAQAYFGLAIQLLILSSGMLAMVGGPRWLIISMLVGIAVVAATASLVCQQKAEQGREWIRRHPEAEPS